MLSSSTANVKQRGITRDFGEFAVAEYRKSNDLNTSSPAHRLYNFQSSRGSGMRFLRTSQGRVFAKRKFNRLRSDNATFRNRLMLDIRL